MHGLYPQRPIVRLHIVEALSADIASGRLVRGQQLPIAPRRGALEVDLTTLTRVYGEVRRRGLPPDARRIGFIRRIFGRRCICLCR